MMKTWGLGLCFCLAASSASASPLLTPSAEVLIEQWLGLGDVDFTNVYTKQGGDTSTTWHAAVDGKGPTITLLEIIIEGRTSLIGGYDPLAWSSNDGYHFSGDYNDFSAFIFNLTDPQVRYQKTSPLSDGNYQTYNVGYYGPTFGAGYDLHVDGALGGGDEAPWSYGPGYYYNDPGLLLPNNTSGGLYTTFQVGALETYTLVPEPASVTLLGTGLIAAWRARKRFA